MRFKYVSDDGTDVKCVRVKPMKLGKAVTIGNIPVADPAYVKAEVAVGVIFMNEIMQNLIPTAITNAGGGMTFGGSPGYEGTFKWINEYDKDETSCNLYVMRPDGSNIRRLSVNKDGDYLPHVLDDGMIAYTRWEYHERSWAFIQSIGSSIKSRTTLLRGRSAQNGQRPDSSSYRMTASE